MNKFKVGDEVLVKMEVARVYNEKGILKSLTVRLRGITFYVKPSDCQTTPFNWDTDLKPGMCFEHKTYGEVWFCFETESGHYYSMQGHSCPKLRNDFWDNDVLTRHPEGDL